MWIVEIAGQARNDATLAVVILIVHLGSIFRKRQHLQAWRHAGPRPGIFNIIISKNIGIFIRK